MAKTNLVLEVVCDAGPLIHLDELGCLDLLADFSVVLVPDAVWREVDQHRPEALERTGVQLTRTEAALPDQIELTTLVRAFSLDAGEQSALALMHQRPQAILLTDDAAARLVAERLGIRVHGTLGVMSRAIRRVLRMPAQVLALLRSIPQQSTLYIRPGLLNSIIVRVQREFGL